MLRYEVKLSDDSIRREKLVWREKYLSPSLSCITGVTDPSYHLEKFNKLASTNSIINIDSALDLECRNVKRQGYIIVKEKEYDTFSDSTIDYSIEKTGKTIDYQYMVNNEKYFYWGKFENEDKSGYTINNLLNYDSESGKVVETIKVESGKTANPLKIDTVYWIEDGEVEIDGGVYVYDRNEGEGRIPENTGILKFKDSGDALEPSAITRCKTIEFYPYDSAAEYEEVTKFSLCKKDKQEESFSRITFARYYYYVKYKNNYCQVKQKFGDDDYQFVCEIPLYVLSGKTEEWTDNMQTKEYPLYFVDDESSDDISIHYEECCDDEHLVNKANVEKHLVYNINDLKKVNAFIFIDEEEKAYFKVEHNVLNANDGNEIIIYLDNVYAPLQAGEQIIFEDNLEKKHESLVYNSTNYSGEDEEYVIFNSKKYLVEKNLLDKAIINNNEYDIDYINGKAAEKDCLVYIGDEKVPMYIKNTDGGEYSEGVLKRYGKIVSGGTDLSNIIDAEYDIKPYSGITVDGRKYIIYERPITESVEGVEELYKYAAIGLPKKYTFNILEKLGNSTYICEPDVNNSEFTDEFNRMISGVICGEVVGDQHSYTMYIDNKIFGEKLITKELPFIKNSAPVSSDDYYDLFNDLTIFVKNGYIHIPLSLRMDVANNMMQDDIVTKDFYEAEKKKAINPIVDMEKDVYLPKYIYGYYTDDEHTSIHEYGEGEKKMYRGSSTMFKSIYQINLNFHFRTRNLESWKVNDGNALYDTSATTDNWFITDFHPYCDILKKKRAESGDTLMQASDLMGLLYFTNDDIFYQRSKVAKSFARLSFYDSTDPQTQSLLATSCIFVDEHKLFKKFIDNSKKYEREYCSTSTPIFEEINGYIQEPKKDIASEKNIYKVSKIAVNTEYLNWTSARTEYNTYENDGIKANVGAEDHRISSRLVVDNKYTTDTSSEGFYIYIFREYAENLHPKPIYMKIEFNHAGIGKMIPFLIPMHWKEKQGTKSNKMIPERSLTLKDENDEKELKEGFPLSYVYAQTYIPLYAVYDFDRKEYGYVFDSRYAVEDENGTLNLNLFEMKIKDESQIKPSEQDLKDIKTNKQIKAVINVNTDQFDKKAFNYETE